MSTGVSVPTGFGWVAASLLSTAVVLQWQSVVVAKARKSAAIEYPRLYADKAEMATSNAAVVFNCKQRAHQNTLEHMPTLLIATLIAAIRYPKLAAAACGTWSLGRILYTIGYSSGVPAKVRRVLSLAFLPDGPMARSACQVRV
ncbi:hypothetical protein OF83DRAFT_124155 [Amylostereum chailletii]|nr:hypothetical protein OF83DRAFT_124155 [Amylostereum chailletii]